LGELWGPLTHEFVLTRSIRDTAAVLDAIAGAAPGDPYTAPPLERPCVLEVETPPGRLRIGYRTAAPGSREPSHPDCVAGIEATARLLDELGHDVTATEISALDADIGNGLWAPMSVGIAREVDRWCARLGRDITDELEPGNQLAARLGRETSAVEYVAALDRAQHWSRGVASWWEDHDVLVMPTSPEPPVALGELTPGFTDPAVAARLARLVAFTWPFDVTGQPAISLPLHWNADGLPIGVQLVAAYGREDILLRVAAQLEAARPWEARRPGVHA
jgi:amidase